NHFGRRSPIRPFGLAFDCLDARPGETLAADADAVADRLAATENVVEVRVSCIDDDRARRLVARIVHGYPAQVGPHLIAIVGRTVTEPGEWIGGCLGGKGAGSNGNGCGSRNTAQRVHDEPPSPMPISRRRGRRGSNPAQIFCLERDAGEWEHGGGANITHLFNDLAGWSEAAFGSSRAPSDLAVRLLELTAPAFAGGREVLEPAGE